MAGNTAADGERAAMQAMRERGESGLVGHCFVLRQLELTLPKGYQLFLSLPGITKNEL